MSFRDGLMRARGQIAFVLALAASTAAIIYLENISAQEALERQVAERLAQSSTSVPGLAMTAEVRQQAMLALAEADIAVDGEAENARQDLSMASALAAAALSGGLDRNDAIDRAGLVWARLFGVESSEAASARAILSVAFPGIGQVEPGAAARPEN